MRILYIGNFKPIHSTETHIAATLEDMGHKVDRLQEDSLEPNNIYIPFPGKFDLLLWTRTWKGHVTQQFLDKFKKAEVPTVSYHLDLYLGIKREADMADDPFWRTDYVFTPDGDPKSAEIFKQKGINHHYLPPGVFKPECVIGTPQRRFQHDIVFVGGSIHYHPEDWPYRMKLIKWLADTYGRRFRLYPQPNRPAIRNQELNDLYASAKVVIGDSLCKNFNHVGYWSDRVYETTGRGGFIIHPYIKGLENSFALNTYDGELITYNYNEFDYLKQLIDYFTSPLGANDRENIRKAGHERTKRDHTYHNRLASMFEVVGNRG